MIPVRTVIMPMSTAIQPIPQPRHDAPPYPAPQNTGWVCKPTPVATNRPTRGLRTHQTAKIGDFGII